MKDRIFYQCLECRIHFLNKGETRFIRPLEEFEITMLERANHKVSHGYCGETCFTKYLERNFTPEETQQIINEVYQNG